MKTAKNKVLLQKKVNRALFILATMLVVLLVIFTFQMFTSFSYHADSLSTQVSNTIIDSLEDNFLSIEQTAISLSSGDELISLLKTSEPLEFHQKADDVREILDKIFINQSLVYNVLAYTSDGTFSRLRGDLGNTSATRIYNLLADNEHHILLKLENEIYIAYVSSIYENDILIGHLVFLMKSDDISSLFSNLSYGESLEIGLMVDSELVASTNEDHISFSLNQLEEELKTYSKRQIGFTPYTIIVSDKSVLISLLPNLLLLLMVSLIIFIFILSFAYAFLKKSFFSPMIDIISSTEQIDIGKTPIAETGQYEFDALVKQINSMVLRVAKSSEDLFLMESQMQKAEIDKQKAIIVSLKKQINAHFTVNTLNVIRRLNELNETEKASLMCDGLSIMLRYANDGDEMIRCVDEIITLEKYTEVMEIRYPNKLSVVYDINDEIFDFYIPRMLLQPILENSIIHGFHTGENYQIKVTAIFENNDITFEITDNGVGINNEILTKLQNDLSNISTIDLEDKGIEHIALLNIQKRIKSMFGENYGLTISSKENVGTKVLVKISVK